MESENRERKTKIAMLCERSYDPLKDLLKGDELANSCAKRSWRGFLRMGMACTSNGWVNERFSAKNK